MSHFQAGRIGRISRRAIATGTSRSAPMPVRRKTRLAGVIPETATLMSKYGMPHTTHMIAKRVSAFRLTAATPTATGERRLTRTSLVRQDVGHQARPPGLVGGPEARAAVAVEVLVEGQQAVPRRVALEQRRLARHFPPPLGI